MRFPRRPRRLRIRRRACPWGILGSLVICTVLYILFSWVLTGVASYKDFANAGAGHEASVAYRH